MTKQCEHCGHDDHTHTRCLTQCMACRQKATNEIELTISDTPYSIDTYSLFAFDCEDLLIDDDKTYDDYEWKYDTKNYIQSLADNWLALMNDNIIDTVILSITSDGPAFSPREYNFRTDNAPITIEYNATALHQYIDTNHSSFLKEKRYSSDGYVWLGTDEDAMILFYLETASTKLYPTESYILDQYENVSQYDYVEHTIK